MHILGITGPIKHGKSTLAHAFADLEPKHIHLESGVVIAEVAEALHMASTAIPASDNITEINAWLRPLPAILQEKLHLSTDFEKIRINTSEVTAAPVEYEKLFLYLKTLAGHPSLAEQMITKQNKEQYRPFLQWLGGYLVQKVSHGIWYEELVRRAKAAESDGCQLALIGGLRFPSDAAIIREAGGVIISINRPDQAESDLTDPTERERKKIAVDSLIVNNGSVDELKSLARTIYGDIKEGKLLELYRTAVV